MTISDRRITGRLKESDGRKTTLVATRVGPDVAARLKKFNVPYTRVVDNTLLRDLLSWVVPALVLVGLWFFMIRCFAEEQGGIGGSMSIGKSRDKVDGQTDTGVSAADMAGADEATASLRNIKPHRHKHPNNRLPLSKNAMTHRSLLNLVYQGPPPAAGRQTRQTAIRLAKVLTRHRVGSPPSP